MFANEICAPLHKVSKGHALYEFRNDISGLCRSTEECWIQFNPPEDQIVLKLDQKIIIDLKGKSTVSNEFLLLPLNQSTGILSVEALDSNQNVKFPKSFCIKLGTFNELRWKNALDWFLRTGINLYSAYFLFIISIFLFLSFWFRKSALGISLFIYSFVSSVYLISFSEYPRAVLDPVLATGAIHFPLRLLQDLSLVYVFLNLYQKYDSASVIRKLSWIYIAVIGFYGTLLLVGVRDYIYYERIIILFAPLVAAPMAIGTIFAFKVQSQTERKIVIPASIILLLFQLNDLFVFWGISESYFTVRFYIPLIVCLALYMYFKKMHDDILGFQTEQQRQKVFKEFLHDLKSPLSVLKIFITDAQFQSEQKQIMNSALDRIEGMVNQIDSGNKDQFVERVELSDMVSSVVAQKKIEFRHFDISFEESHKVFTVANKNKLERIVSNLINNAFESYSSSYAQLKIQFIKSAEEVVMQFMDNGVGISKNLLSKLTKESITTKNQGQGIGLISACEYIQELGGNVKIYSKESVGTVVEIKLKTIQPEVDLKSLDIAANKSLQSLDLVLIDDDRYIRMAWQLYANNSNKKISTFESVHDFISSSETIQRECPIYLDYNLKNEKSTRYIPMLHELGFKNIILATGESLREEEVPEYVVNVIGKLPPIQ